MNFSVKNPIFPVQISFDIKIDVLTMNLVLDYKLY